MIIELGPEPGDLFKGMVIYCSCGRDTLPSAGRMPRRRTCRRSDRHVLLLGPLGVGKSRLARRLTTSLPALTLAEALKPTRIARVAGLAIHGIGDDAPVSRPLPDPLGCGADRRRAGAVTGRGVAGPPRCALLGCAAGVPPPRARSAAPAARRWCPIHTISRTS
jgi:Magnesium chelatase, subunit ChlI